jgi:hypothetical protein
VKVNAWLIRKQVVLVLRGQWKALNLCRSGLHIFPLVMVQNVLELFCNMYMCVSSKSEFEVLLLISWILPVPMPVLTCIKGTSVCDAVSKAVYILSVNGSILL